MNELKWAVLGTGVIANEMAQALHNMGRTLYGVCNRTYDKAVSFAKKYHVEKVYTSYKCALSCTGQTDDAENFAAADVEVDAVERRDLAGSAGECFVETSDANDSVLFQVHSS